MSALADRPLLQFLLIAAVCIAVLGGAQLLAHSSAPAGGVSSTGRVIGQTGYAYLGGLRTFGAALLWNRLDPIFHEYYSANFNRDFVVFMPSIRLVIALDPQFVQAYYTASYYLARGGKVDQGVALALEGIRNNPTSGLLRANYIEVLQIASPKKNLAKMLEQARMGIGANMTYANSDDEFEAYGVFRSVFVRSGDTQTAAVLAKAQERLRGQGAAPGVERNESPVGSPTSKK